MASTINQERVWSLTTYTRDTVKRCADCKFRYGRTVGLFQTAWDAISVLENDIGDLDEAGYYQYAVVEPLMLGLYPLNSADDRLWFEHRFPHPDDKHGMWVRLDGFPEGMRAQLCGSADFGTWSRIG